MDQPNNSHDHQSNTPQLTHESVQHDEVPSQPIVLSKYSKALLDSWEKGVVQLSTSPVRISVSQTVSFAAFLYEKMRNAVEFREEHLIRRAAIERIIKRRMILNENGRDIAEPLIKELLWARYYENNTLGEEKIGQVQMIVDKYFFLRNELSAGRPGKEQESIGNFIVEVLSCEVEELLSPNPRREALVNYVYQIIRTTVSSNSFKDEMERDIQIYVAIERTFAHADNPTIRYHLLKLMVPHITKITWKTSDSVLPQLYEAFETIEKSVTHPLGDRVRNAIRKMVPPFLIMRDMFEQNSKTIGSIITDETRLKHKVDESCRKRYDESRGRLRRTAVRSFIYILLTKVIFAFIIELPYDFYIAGEISYLPISVNVIFPPLLMTFIIITTQIPGDDNTKRIYQLIKGIVSRDPADDIHEQAFIDISRRIKSRSITFTALFTTLYLGTYLITFGAIIYILTLLGFNIASQGIFIFFVTLVTFFAFRVISITQEYQVVSREGLLSPILDFFFLPIMRVGQWLSGEVLTKFNVLMFIFDFIIEMPFKAIVEVFDEWVHFVRIKKEEIV